MILCFSSFSLCSLVMWTDSFVSSSWVLRVQVFGRPVEDAFPPSRCPAQLGSLHWCVACSGVAPVWGHAVFNRSFSWLFSGRPLPSSPRPRHFSSQSLSGIFGAFLTSPPAWLWASTGSPIELDFPVVNWQTHSQGAGEALPFDRVPGLLTPVIAEIGHTHCSSWGWNLYYGSLFCQIPSVSRRGLALPRLARYGLFRLSCRGHSLLLSSCLCRIKWKEKFFLQLLRTIFAGLTSFWIVPHLSFSGATSLALLLPFLTSGPELGALPNCWASVKFLRAPIPERSWVAPPPRFCAFS